MKSLVSEMTREEVRRIAPQATAVLPVGSIEQHGPHLPVWTDSLVCETIASRAAELAASQTQVAVAPILHYGNSHHHFPFPGVLSLTSPTFLAAVTEILESLVLTGFRKLVILNGHGGNTEAISMVARDMVNRLGHPVCIATGAYWEIGRDALTANNLLANELIPGHAGHFETALVMAIRPDLVDMVALAQLANMPGSGSLDTKLNGATVHVHGLWSASGGYSDDPSTATTGAGREYLDIIVKCVANFFVAFHNRRYLDG